MKFFNIIIVIDKNLGNRGEKLSVIMGEIAKRRVDMPDSQRHGDAGYNIVARVISQKGHCPLGHKVGDEVFFDGQSVQGKICIHALYSFISKVFAMRYGANFPWLENPEVATHPCPDAKNPVVFEIRRLRK